MDNYVLIFVPHQDDEICLMGEYLDRRLYKDDVRIKLVYLTNGDYMTAAATRQAEALKTARLFEIAEKDVVFMGSPDTPCESGTPYTEERLCEIAISIEQILMRFTPSIIFCTDLDPHPDHHALSLCFDRAMASVLNKAADYRPHVFKGFAYSTAFYGQRDYARINNPPTTVPNPARPDNPSFNWNNRICLKNPGAVNQTPLWKNRIYKALLKHNSQCGLHFYQSIVNGDQVFFRKRTDNLLLSGSTAKVTATSGIKEYLYDFSTGRLCSVMDCSNQTALLKGIWEPDPQDQSPVITIHFKQPLPIGYINVNGNPNRRWQQAAGKILINGESVVHFEKLEEFGKDTFFEIHNPQVSTIHFILQQPCSGISEIGLFKNEDTFDLFHPVMPNASNINANSFYQRWINCLEWLYIRLSRVNFRLCRKAKHLLKKVKKI